MEGAFPNLTELLLWQEDHDWESNWRSSAIGFIVFRIVFLRAVRTQSMAEYQFRVFGKILFYTIPISLVVADTFAEWADRQHTLQGFNLDHCLLQIVNQLFLFPFCFQSDLNLLLQALIHPVEVEKYQFERLFNPRLNESLIDQEEWKNLCL